MSFQYSTLGGLSRELRPASAVPMADRSQVHQHGNQEPEQIDPGDW